MCTDSLYYDAQNSLEKTLAALTHAQARVSVVWGVGSMESEKSISPVQAVIDNEIVGMVKRYLDGFPVDRESIALDVIRKTGITGEFLSSEHTLTHFRGTQFQPEVLVRMERSAAGEDDNLTRRAEEAVSRVLSCPKEKILDEAVEKELLKIEKKYAQ